MAFPFVKMVRPFDVVPARSRTGALLSLWDSVCGAAAASTLGWVTWFEQCAVRLAAPQSCLWNELSSLSCHQIWGRHILKHTSRVVKCSELEHLNGKGSKSHNGILTRWQMVWANKLAGFELVFDSWTCCCSFSDHKGFVFCFDRFVWCNPHPCCRFTCTDSAPVLEQSCLEAQEPARIWTLLHILPKLYAIMPSPDLETCHLQLWKHLPANHGKISRDSAS